jgi:hypothetical protein
MKTEKIVQYRGESGMEVLTNGDRELKKALEAVTDHEWFDSKNMKGAKRSIESAAYAAFERLPSQVKLHMRDTITFYNKDRAERSVSIGRKLGLKTKIFSMHKGEEVFPFTVKSTKWDWEVHALEMSEERVPLEFLQRVNLFSRNGVTFDRMAIAVPGKPKYEPLRRVLKTETKNTFNGLAGMSEEVGKSVGKASRRGAAAVAPAAAGIASAGLVVGAIAALLLLDPVLLGCYGHDPIFLVEVGRWG